MSDQLFECDYCYKKYRSGDMKFGVDVCNHCKPEWISVKDRLPDERIADKDGWLEYASYSVYLDRTFGFKYAYWVYVGDGEWWREDTDDTTDSKHVTHWMPLPSPPEVCG